MNIYNKITNLTKEIKYHTILYNLGKPVISDKEWDDKYFELKALEEEYNFVLYDSPTQTIVYQTVPYLEKVTHSHNMLSLDKTKEMSDLISFADKETVLIMGKMDGLTCSLTYDNGEVISAETRGNGVVGENIIHNARVISTIPKKIPIKEKLVIDGEIICTYNDFEEFKEIYKNPRNFATGSIRLLEADVSATRNLTFVAWEVIEGMNDKKWLSSKLLELERIGFTRVPFIVSYYKKDIEKLSNIVKDMCSDKSYPIDGLVIKYDDIAYGRSLGETSHHARNAIAYKFYDETYSTHLLDIEWTMGRTGVLTPVAVFEPIDIDGSTVERASLHNINIMEELFHGTPFKNQRVEVYKANMIIPQIYSADNARDMAFYCELPFFDIPEACPVWGGEVKVSESDSGTRELICLNPLCNGKAVNRFDHFCGKKGLDIKGLSKATLEKLLEWNWLQSYEDLFNLTEFQSDWIKKPGFGQKSVERVLNAIEESRHCELHQFIAALGIPLIGTAVSKELVKVFPTWNSFIEAIQNDYKFYTISGFGVEMHNALTNFDYSEAIVLAKEYLTFEEPKVEEKKEQKLDGKVFVITGTLKHFKNREELKECILSYGGKVSSSISKNTHYLINNNIASTSSKNKSAQAMNIPIITEEEFIQMLNN